MRTNLPAGAVQGILLALLPLLFYSCSGTGKSRFLKIDTVPYVDLARYTGTWYEISRFPNSFQKDCFGTTATYSIRPDGSIAVLNECRKKSMDGKKDSAKGKAWVVDKQSNAKLKVQFFWPFRGDYWIIDLGKDYDYAVVSDPKGKYLWILCRTSVMPEKQYQGIVDWLMLKGFDTEKLIRTPQAAASSKE